MRKNSQPGRAVSRPPSTVQGRARRALGVVVAAATMLVPTALIAGPASAAPPTPHAGQAIVAAGVQDSCASVRARASILAASGTQRAMCLRPVPADQVPPSTRAAAAKAVPDSCLGAMPELTWVIDRFSGCRQEFGAVDILVVPQGTWIGTIDIVTITSVRADARALTWTHDIQIVKLGGRGDINGVIPEGVASCPVECTVTAQNFPYRLMDSSPAGTSTMTSAVVPGTSGQVVAEQAQWTVIFTQMGSLPSPPVTFTSEPVRCDTNTPNATAGCVLSRHTPTLHYTTAVHDELAAHISTAQAGGLPGAPGGTPLTRLVDPVQQQKNRDTACPSSIPRPEGEECDEYPFASTNQGAFTSGGAYSSMMIDKDDNQRGGTDLAGFYLDNRIMSNDPFYVQID